MKLETFFEKFDQFADAPDAVAKMRELVLHLAVHGNLVSQSAGDELAGELLERSRAEMTKRMAARQAKQEKPAEPVSEEETNFSIPAGWAWCRLVDAGQFINGLAFKPSDWGGVGRPIIRIQNLSGRNPDYNRTTGKFDSSVLVQDGDILVSWSATLDAFIWRGEEAVLNQHIFRVLPAPLADKRFLYWLLKWVIRQLAESDHAHGLVMSHINRGPFLAHPIPLPPLAEQKRIVAKVDELMVLCDRKR
jgi:type I restriction enzyme S subunit